MQKRENEKGRVRSVLLVLLWLWATLIFVVIDLFFNVTQFDAIRPDSEVYRATRYAAHKLVGEPYRDGDFVDELPGRAVSRTPESGCNRLAALPEARRKQLFEELCGNAGADAPAPGRVTALRALAAAFGGEARPFLLGVVRDRSASQGTRAEAARLVGQTGADALATLDELLAADLPGRVKAGAVLGLAEVGTAEAARRATALTEGKPSLVQVMAVRALERFGRAECAPPLAAKARDHAAAKETRVAACRGLGRTGAVGELQQILLDAKAPRPVRMAAIEALETIEEPEAIAALQAAAGVASPEVARRADIARSRLVARKTN